LKQSCITSLLIVLNNFIKNRLTAKKEHPRPYSKIGMHLHLISSISTSSETNRPIFPKIAFVALQYVFYVIYDVIL